MGTRRILLWLCLALVSTGCSYHPARFADRPAVTEVADDDPVAQPGRRELNWNWYLSDVYLRRSLLDALDPKRPADAGDVNAMDEVPRSSWFQPVGPELILQDPPIVDEGPPEPPLTVVPDVPRANDYGMCVIDARGIRYELRRDDKWRPEMRTSAAVIASRLIRAFGLLAPETHIVFLGPSDFVGFEPGAAASAATKAVERFLGDGPPSVDGRYRMSSARWPVGIDVGVSESYDVRGDDPNDVIAHRNRRTLRSLKVLGAWLRISNINPRKTRDAYVGPPGQGHLRHYLVSLEDALGAGAVVGDRREGLRTDLGGGTGFNLITFGLWPGTDEPPTQRRLLALGNISDSVDPGGFEASPPYAPIRSLSGCRRILGREAHRRDPAQEDRGGGAFRQNSRLHLPARARTAHRRPPPARGRLLVRTGQSGGSAADPRPGGGLSRRGRHPSRRARGRGAVSRHRAR